MKILTVVGARPQFVKAAVVSRCLHQQSGVTEVLVHTGQHYDQNMSGVFFQELDLPPPDHHLGVGSGSHGAQTGRMLEALDQVITQVLPDKVLVYGDTNSTLAGALAAAKLHVPVAHVEAGLRSFNRHMPEEINRVVADHVAAWLFAPTEAAVENLRREGRPADSIFLVGDVMFDAALLFGARPSSILQQHNLSSGEYVLATLHRAENTDDPQKLQVIIQALSALTETIPVVVPLHPRCRLALERQGQLEQAARACRLLEPLGYVDMMALEKNARLIATDSGGVQKEAFFHGVPCVTLRAETEWVELVQCGWNRLAPPHSAAHLTSALLQALADDALPPRPDLYGQGRSAERIVRLLCAA